MPVIQRDVFSNITHPKQKPQGGPKTQSMDWEFDMKGRQQWSFLGTAFYKLSLNIGHLNQRREANLIMASLNSGYKINRNRQYAAATDQLVLPFGRLQMAVGGKCLYFFKRWRWVWCALDVFFLYPSPPTGLSVIGCQARFTTCPRAWESERPAVHISCIPFSRIN